MNIHWDAEKYASDFNFVQQYGQDLLNLLTVPAGSRVLDLGCGNGALTRRLADAGYSVEGIDASPEHVALAEKRYPDLAFAVGDATKFALKTPVNAVFSNAVFHWIDREKQPLLAQCISDALVAGGELVCEFGGFGNNAKIHEGLAGAFARRGLVYRMPFYFPSVGEYAPLLERHGLQVRFASLFDRFTELQGEEGLADWIRMFIKTPFADLPHDTCEQIISETTDRLKPRLYKNGKWHADYVRLRIKAVKS